MKKNVILISILSFLLSFSSLSQWEWQNPLPQGNTLNDVFFLNQDMGWAVGELGIIIRTLDGGETYKVLKSNVQVNLNSVEFFSPQHGFVVGDNGTILETDNGGESWNAILYGMTANLNDLCMVSPNKVWIGGNQGNILHSNDGGDTWELQFDDTATFINSIYFLNNISGWAAGSNNSSEGLVLQTYDGGNTWTEISVGALYPFRTIHFTSSLIGWAVVSGQIYKTMDGGINWVLISSGFFEDDSFYDIFFTDQENGWVVGEGEYVPVTIALIYYTNDGGETWQEQQSSTWRGLKSIYFIDIENGCAVGDLGNIVQTSNSGNNWYVSCGSYSGGYLTDVFFIDQNYGWTVGGEYYPSFSEILHTVDGGENWYEQEAPVNFLTSVYFLNQNEGWITGTGSFAYDINVILHTTNGGDLWETQYSESDEWYFHALKDIAFLDSENGWAVGGSQHVYPPQEPILLFTEDGGESWNDYSYLTDKSLSAVYFLDQENGWIAGHEIILHTSDGGQTWNVLWSGIHSFQDICFVDNDHGWVIGDSISMIAVSDVIMRTSDGGITWEKKYFEGSYEKKIFFNDINHGWLACDENLYYTINGGVTWEEQFTGSGAELGGVCFVDNNLGWVVGSNSTILHTDNGGVITEIPKPKIPNSKVQLLIYPNPINGNTTIEFEITQSGLVELSVYDLSGKLCGRIISGQMKSGNHQIIWNTEGIPSGVYFCVLKTNEGVQTRKIVKL